MSVQLVTPGSLCRRTRHRRNEALPQREIAPGLVPVTTALAVLPLYWLVYYANTGDFVFGFFSLTSHLRRDLLRDMPRRLRIEYEGGHLPWGAKRGQELRKLLHGPFSTVSYSTEIPPGIIKGVWSLGITFAAWPRSSIPRRAGPGPRGGGGAISWCGRGWTQLFPVVQSRTAMKFRTGTDAGRVGFR